MIERKVASSMHSYRNLTLFFLLFQVDKKHQKKKAAVCGLQHRDYKGNIVPARTSGPPCNCTNECFEKVYPELQFHILARFKSQACKARQDHYLNGLIIASDPKTVGPQGKGGKFTDESQGRRKNTFRYYVPTG